MHVSICVVLALAVGVPPASGNSDGSTASSECTHSTTTTCPETVPTRSVFQACCGAVGELNAKIAGLEADKAVLKARVSALENQTHQSTSTESSTASGADDEVLQVLQELKRVTQTFEYKPVVFQSGADYVITRVQVSGNHLFTTGRDPHHAPSEEQPGTVNMWDMPSETLIRQFRTDTTVWSIAAAGEYLFAACSDGNVRMWNTTSGEPVRDFFDAGMEPSTPFMESVEGYDPHTGMSCSFYDSADSCTDNSVAEDCTKMGGGADTACDAVTLGIASVGTAWDCMMTTANAGGACVYTAPLAEQCTVLGGGADPNCDAVVNNGIPATCTGVTATDGSSCVYTAAVHEDCSVSGGGADAACDAVALGIASVGSAWDCMMTTATAGGACVYTAPTVSTNSEDTCEPTTRCQQYPKARSLFVLGNHLFVGYDDEYNNFFSSTGGCPVYTGYYDTTANEMVNKWEACPQGSNNVVKMYEIDTGNLVRDFKGHDTGIYQVHVHGNYLFTGFGVSYNLMIYDNMFPGLLSAMNRSVMMWDIATGDHLSTFLNLGDGFEVLTGLAASDDYLYTLENSKWPKMWSIASGELVHTFVGHMSGVNAMALSGDLLLTSSSDMTVKVWDVVTQQEVRTIPVVGSNFGEALFESDGYVYAAVNTAVVKVKFD